MYFRIRGNRVYKVRNRMDERVFISDHVPGRPPRSEVGMDRLRAEDRLEPWFVGRIAPIAILQLIHTLKAEAERPLTAIDFPFVIILVPRRQARRFERAIRSSRYSLTRTKLRQKNAGVIDRHFLGAFACRRFEPDRLRLTGTFFDEGFLKPDRLGNFADEKSRSIN